MTGTEYFTIPHVGMGWAYNVKIELHDCDYTGGWCEPFDKYMSMFEKQKNDADRKKKEFEAQLVEANKNGASTERKEELESGADVHNFTSEQSKLFLVSLTG